LEELMQWTVESNRAGVKLEVASDDLGEMGAPGTWHRVRQGDCVSNPTRNRGDALRLFQRKAFRASGA
jgi:hypothetical protein